MLSGFIKTPFNNGNVPVSPRTRFCVPQFNNDHHSLYSHHDQYICARYTWK
jgi:hypothetical protein